MDDAECFSLNRAAWDARTPFHLASRFYDVAAFKAGACSLREIELAQVGDVAGRSLLHLQCHFGQDTLSWARRGARVTGLDPSGAAVTAARSLAAELGLDARFVEGNVFDAPALVGGEAFDVVFTLVTGCSGGCRGWSPGRALWRRACGRAGCSTRVEFHPAVWMWDDAFERVAYAYDGPDAPIVSEQTGTYADRDAPVALRDVGFNHGLGSVVSALLGQGLRLEHLREYDWSPYDIFPDMDEVAPGRFRMRRFGARLPLVYGLAARRPA